MKPRFEEENSTYEKLKQIKMTSEEFNLNEDNFIYYNIFYIEDKKDVIVHKFYAKNDDEALHELEVYCRVHESENRYFYCKQIPNMNYKLLHTIAVSTFKIMILPVILLFCLTYYILTPFVVLFELLLCETSKEFKDGILAYVQFPFEFAREFFTT